MRIALVLPGFSAGPEDWAIPALLNLARGLARRHEVYVFSQRYPEQGIYRFDGLVHYAMGGGQRFGPASLRTWVKTAQAVVAHHRRSPFDLLHAFWADEAGLSAALAGAMIRRPVVVSLGGGELSHLPDIAYGAQRFLARRFNIRLALGRAAVVTAGSTYQLELGRRHGLAEAKLRLAPLGVDTDRFSVSRRGRPAFQAPVLIQAASLLPVKNQALLLEVLSRVRAEIPGIRLHLAGEGPLRGELARLAGQLGLAGQILWPGQTPYLQMPALYRQAQLYLQTSRHESQGMAVLEAMACGLPVTGTPVGVMPEVAGLPPSSEPAVLAAQVVEILGDPARYRLLSRQARHIAETRFSLPATEQRFQEIYENVRREA